MDKLIYCIKEGRNACAKFINERLEKRTVWIHSTISKVKFKPPKTTLNLDIKALIFIEYGCHRGFTIEELLQHEITKSVFFLVDKDGYLRKSVKSQLVLKMCILVDKKGPETSPQTHAIVIDFMALVRKVTLKKFESPVKMLSPMLGTSVMRFTSFSTITERTASRMGRGKEEESQKS